MHQTLDLIGGLQQQAALILENPGQMTDLTGERNLVLLFLFFLIKRPAPIFKICPRGSAF